MGRVFTTEQIAYGEVPKRGAQQEAGQFLLHELEETGIPIEGAMVYGSTTANPNARSDVDMLITTRLNDGETLTAIRTLLEQAEHRYRAPVEAQVLPSEGLIHPLQHSIDPLFAEQLIAAANNKRWVVGYPIDRLNHFELTDRRLRNIGIQYSSAKAKKFTKAILEFRGEIDYHTLQRALEVPAALGRKVLPATEAFRTDAEDEYVVENKPTMIRATEKRIDRLYRSLGSYSGRGILSDNPSSTYAALVQRDYDYNVTLREAIHGGITLDDYSDWLRGNYLSTLELAREVSADAAELVRRSTMVDLGTIDWDEPIYNDEDAPFDDEFDDLPLDDVY